MKVQLDKDEWFPVWTFSKDLSTWRMSRIVEIDDETFKRWEATFEAFELLQAELRSLLDGEA